MSLLGEQAPNFTLENTAGKTVTLSETLDRGPTVVIMFRAGWCSFYAEQLQTFSEIAQDLWYNHNTNLLRVSSDSLGNLAEMRDRYELKIQFLTDPNFEVTKAYTEVVEHKWRDDYTRSGTFVVDTQGRVLYEHISQDSPDRTYGNFLRYFIKQDYEDVYGVTSGQSVQRAIVRETTTKGEKIGRYNWPQPSVK